MKRPQFSLRDLLWLTVVVVLAICLWLDRSEIALARAKQADAIQQVSNLHDAMYRAGVAHQSEMKVTNRQLALLEAELAKEGWKIKWVAADNEFAVKIERSK